jgi:hypothetical protein
MEMAKCAGLASGRPSSFVVCRLLRGLVFRSCRFISYESRAGGVCVPVGRIEKKAFRKIGRPQRTMVCPTDGSRTRKRFLMPLRGPKGLGERPRKMMVGYTDRYKDF